MAKDEEEDLESYWWCHVYYGVIHAARYYKGWLTTITDDEEGKLVCDKQTRSKLRLLWRERYSYAKTQGYVVCDFCDAAVDDEAEWLERARIANGE